MKIAVPAQGADLAAQIDARFGRATHFILYDDATRAWEVVDNSVNLELPQGAGIQAATTVKNAGAEVLLSRHCGPKAFRVLQAAGVAVVLGATGTVATALAAYAAGELRPAAQADVEGHA
jgi:predicted Fe-Mo cluster-binding NifX family protein